MPTPVLSIDHLRINVTDLDRAVDDYRLLLGTTESRRIDEAGRPSAIFEAGNLAVCLLQDKAPPGLRGLCFRIDDKERMRRRANNLGLDLKPDALDDPLQGLLGDPQSSALDQLQPDGTRGLDISFVARPGAREFAKAGVLGLDHVVIGSADGDGTAMLLGARLGLDLRMDMSRPEWNARLMFFRCGDLIVEVFQQLENNPNVHEDSFYGLSWRVADAHLARLELSEAGFDVSDVRKGRKPGTRVCTVRDRTADVATLLLQPPGQGQN